jgi:hypothetical protein
MTEKREALGAFFRRLLATLTADGKPRFAATAEQYERLRTGASDVPNLSDPLMQVGTIVNLSITPCLPAFEAGVYCFLPDPRSENGEDRAIHEEFTSLIGPAQQEQSDAGGGQ